MKRRKQIAMLLAFTLLLGTTLTANAAEGTAENLTGNTITGSGEVDYVNTTIYEVVLPTTSTLNLVVDPQGLAGLENGESASAEELSAYAGKITSTGVPVVMNNGSVDMKVSVELQMTGDATPVADAEDFSVSGNDVLLYAIPSDTAVTEVSGGDYVASATGLVLTDTAETVDFILPAAEFEFAKDDNGVASYERTDTPAQGTALTFAGMVNTGADWSTYADGTKALGMTAVFTFTNNLADDDVAAADGPAFMKAYSGTSITITSGSNNGGSQDTYVMSANNDGSVSYTFVNAPSGEATALTVDGNVKSGAIVAGNVTYTNGVLKFNATSVNGTGLGATGSHTVVVTIGGEEYELTYTVS